MNVIFVDDLLEVVVSVSVN